MTQLSILIPVYNECSTVEHAVERVLSVGLDAEIICVDDASTDDTGDVLSRLLRNGKIHILETHASNQGKGAAVRTALARASGEFVVIQDADLEYDPADLTRLLTPLINQQADAVFGTRFRGESRRILYYWHSVGNNLLTTLSNMATNLNLSDMETCYKLIRTDLMRSLPLESCRFGIEPELTARLAQSRARIYELPISYAGRTYAEGKKISWRDGAAALWHIIYFNFFAKKAPRYRPH